MCLLYTNQLPLRVVFGVLDGSLVVQILLRGQLEKNCIGLYQVGQLLDSTIVSAFFVFSYLPEQVVSDLRTDQVCAYSIYWAFIHGKVDDDLAYVEVGPIVYSRWLTLGCRILR